MRLPSALLLLRDIHSVNPLAGRHHRIPIDPLHGLIKPSRGMHHGAPSLLSLLLPPEEASVPAGDVYEMVKPGMDASVDGPYLDLDRGVPDQAKANSTPVDLSPEKRRHMDLLYRSAKQYEQGTKIRPLWGTAQLFLHHRFTQSVEPYFFLYSWKLQPYCADDWRYAAKQFVKKLPDKVIVHRWDTDQFLTDIGEATLVMLSVVRNDGSLEALVRKRYLSFDTEIGGQIEAGKADFEMLEKKAMEWGEPKVPSAKQELDEPFFIELFIIQ
ncbi:hypothetical protein SAY86_013881 [Trapa natans]|uniref:xylose isomerase n=1 Tax=Trapa natans TaxID=22666 RepID=A0AAN7KS15_TRANT|nr:hypothetical protein SAY86_013881 [Trapa natans]